MEGGVETLLLGGRAKKKNKITAGRRGESGRRSEDFITGRKRKKNHCRWEGMVDGGVKTLLLKWSKND